MPEESADRRPLVIGNWKMHKTGVEGAALARAIVAGLGEVPAEVAVAPPFTALAAVAGILHESAVGLAAQDGFFEAAGAFTGAVSMPMLAAAGCSRVLVGHSERRHTFGDTDEVVRRKARAALASGLDPVLCVGETAGQRDAGQAEAVVSAQLGAVTGRPPTTRGGLRTGLGHRNRPHCDSGDRRGDAPGDPPTDRRPRGGRSGGADPSPLRGVGERR